MNTNSNNNNKRKKDPIKLQEGKQTKLLTNVVQNTMRPSATPAQMQTLLKVIHEGINPTITRNNSTNGMNTSNNAKMKNKNGTHYLPYAWPCPFGKSTFQLHQYSGALISTRLGNESRKTNNKGEEDYIPYGQLLYHSAGSGKTLLMLMTIFLWMMKWYAKPPLHNMPPQNKVGPRNKKETHKGICNFIFFISEEQQVKDLAQEHGNFMSIMDAVQNSEFKSHWSNFRASLPKSKVILKFKAADNAYNTGRLPLYQKTDSYGKVESWKLDFVAMICKNKHPFFKRTVPTMGGIMKDNSKFQEDRTLGFNYYENFGDVPNNKLKDIFNDKKKGYAQLNVYLKTITYAFAVLHKTHMDKNNMRNNKNNKSITQAVYEKLTNVAPYKNTIYENYSVALGAYFKFTEELVTQLYSRVRNFVEGAPAFAAQSLAGIDGIGVGNGMQLHYQHFDPGSNAEKIFEEIQEGDFIRFAVNGLENPIDEMTTEKRELGAEKKEGKKKDAVIQDGGHYKEWRQSNKFGVSPFFKVTMCKKMYPKDDRGARISPFYFLKLQRILVHPMTEPGSEFYPLFMGDKDAVTADKKRQQNSQTGTSSNLKKMFRVFDIIRPDRAPLEVARPETMFDSADMNSTQQTLPSQALKIMLMNSGAIMREGDKRELTPKEDPVHHTSAWSATKSLTDYKLNNDLLWWIPYGEHLAWQTLTQGEKISYWKNLKNAAFAATPPVGDDLFKQLEDGIRQPPKMPKTCLVVMTSQMALQLFEKFPDGALFIVDEVQKYTGDQDLPSDPDGVNNRMERQNLYCMLSEAVKHTEFDGDRRMCDKAAKEFGSKKGAPFKTGRKFRPGPGYGQIQVASATPNVPIIDEQKDINELEQLLRLIGQNRNLKYVALPNKLLENNRNEVVKEGKAVKWSMGIAQRAITERVAKALYESKSIVSFVDLGNDVAKVPRVQKRNVEPNTKKGTFLKTSSVVYVSQKKVEIAPNSNLIEDKIGHPEQWSAMNEAIRKNSLKTKGKGKVATKAPTKAPAKAAQGKGKGKGGRKTAGKGTRAQADPPGLAVPLVPLGPPVNNANNRLQVARPVRQSARRQGFVGKGF